MVEITGSRTFEEAQFSPRDAGSRALGGPFGSFLLRDRPALDFRPARGNQVDWRLANCRVRALGSLDRDIQRHPTFEVVDDPHDTPPLAPVPSRVAEAPIGDVEPPRPGRPESSGPLEGRYVPEPGGAVDRPRTRGPSQARAARARSEAHQRLARGRVHFQGPNDPEPIVGMEPHAVTGSIGRQPGVEAGPPSC